MTKIAMLIAILSLPQSAFAIGAPCGSIVKSKARLACYDRLAIPATGVDADVAAQPAKVVVPDLANPFSAEEARTNARLKGICRGC